MTQQPTIAVTCREGLPPQLAALLAVVTVGGIFISIQWVIRLPQVPYNVRELFPEEHPLVSAIVFSILLVWLGLGPVWVGDY